MKEMADDAKILSVLEVRICMQILTGKAWDYFPVAQTEDAIEKRVTEAFLRLVEMGFLKYETEGYVQTREMEETFSLAVKPEFTMKMIRRGTMPTTVTGNRKNITVLEQVAGQDGMLRLYHREGIWLWELVHAVSEDVQIVAEEDVSWENMEHAEMFLHIYKEEQEQILGIWNTSKGKVFLTMEEDEAKELTEENLWQQIAGGGTQ